MADQHRVDALLDFWFGALDVDGHPETDRAALWWGKDRAVDEEVRQRFEADVHETAARKRVLWARDPRGRLALILCMDQLPRNMYRGTPRAFAFDPMARLLCLEGLEMGQDRELAPVQRLFFYLPLEHAEQRDYQQRSVSLFEDLCQEVPQRLRSTYEGYLRYARQHRDIVERFGRFPHRNAILGRQSTSEEAQFLTQPGSGF